MWKESERPWWAALGLSGLLSLVQGGYITVIAHNVVAFALGSPASAVFTETFFCVTIPAFMKYGIDPSMVRFPDTAAWLWLFLSVPGLVYWMKKAGNRGQTIIGLGFFLAVFSGVVIFSVQLISIQAPQISYYIQGIDTQVAQQYWNRLEPGAQILSSNSSIFIWTRAGGRGSRQTNRRL